LGFFKLQRGNNHMQLEACDCWYGNPTWDMEADVMEGKLDGTMYGLVEAAAAVEPRAEARLPLLQARANLLKAAQRLHNVAA
jgi:hypothetical protein